MQNFAIDCFSIDCMVGHWFWIAKLFLPSLPEPQATLHEYTYFSWPLSLLKSSQCILPCWFALFQSYWSNHCFLPTFLLQQEKPFWCVKVPGLLHSSILSGCIHCTYLARGYSGWSVVITGGWRGFNLAVN